MLIANIFRNILSKFYCLHKLLKIKSAGIACPMSNSRRTPLRLLRHHEKCLFMILLQPLSNFFFLSLCLPPKVMDSFPAFLPFSIFFVFRLTSIKNIFYDFPLHNFSSSVCINFHTGKFSNTAGNRTRRSRFLSRFQTEHQLCPFFTFFYFLRRSLSRKHFHG